MIAVLSLTAAAPVHPGDDRRRRIQDRDDVLVELSPTALP